ncbi:MAG TPA: DUF3805 domain-containing protein, partial [Bacteroidia bacterium]|nr:DUF3805 domain-containing protein [Bacteroidia bacterium]
PGNKKFTSRKGYFTMEYPTEWNTWENPDGTYHFEKEVTHIGTLEIKESRNFSDSSEILHFLENESFTHPNAKFDYQTDKTILSYNNMILVEGAETRVFVWIVANRNTVLICRYLLDNKFKNDPKGQAELNAVNVLMQSIAFL